MLFVTIAALASVLGQANAQSLFSSPVSWPGYPSDGFSYGGKVDNVNNQMVFTLLPPANLTTNDIGYGAIATSNQALLYGTVEATVQQATVGGCVTYLTLINQETKDEIDFEWIGNERNTVWTNMFYRGRRERRPVTMDEIWSAQINTGSTDNSVLGSPFTYRIDWTPDSITWWVNGAVIRVLNRASTFEAANTGDKLPYDHYHYPNTPLTVNFGIWDDQDVIWANGPIHWNDTAAQKGFTAKVWDIKVIPYGGNIPMHTDPLVVPALTITNFVDGLPTASPPPASPLPTKTESIATTSIATNSAVSSSMTVSVESNSLASATGTLTTTTQTSGTSSSSSTVTSGSLSFASSTSSSTSTTSFSTKKDTQQTVGDNSGKSPATANGSNESASNQKSYAMRVFVSAIPVLSMLLV